MQMFVAATERSHGNPQAGHRENTQLYERHFSMFESKLGIHLEKYIFESDQETSLKSIFESKKIRYFFCIRHVFAN